MSNVTVKDPAAHGVNCQSSPGIGAPAPQDVQITGSAWTALVGRAS